MTDATPPTSGMLGPFAEFLGLELTEVSGERVACTWEARPALHQPYGILHGGVHCSVVETLASIGAATWLGGQVVGVNNTTDFLRMTKDGPLTSVATPVHQGRSQQVWDVVTTQGDRLVSRGSVRLQNLDPDRG